MRTSSTTYRSTRLLFAISVLLTGCSEPAARSDPRSAPSQDSPATTPETLPPAGCEPLPTRLWRLNDDQYVQAVHDLLPDVDVPAVPTPGRNAYALIDTAGALPVTGSLATLFRASARSVAEQASRTATARVPCETSETPRACAERFVRDFAARAYRRPLRDAEVQRLLGVFDVGAAESFSEGIRLLLEATLQSASFIYRTELGAAGAAPGSNVALTPFETAASLSFFLLNSVPDEELWRAALDGSLDTASGYAAQVERLIALPRVQENLTRILVRWLKLERVLVSERATSSFPEFDGLRQPMLDESKAFLGELLASGGGLGELFTGRHVTLDAKLAEFYGVASTGQQGLVSVDLPAGQRAGVLTEASLIASIKASNRSVHRGLFILREVLCGEIPPPPKSVDTTPPSPEIDTEREFAEYRASQGTCGACHGSFDGIGLSYEHYDALGRYVGTDQQGVPIDASGSIPLDGQQVSFADVTELGQLLAASPQVASCMSQKMLGYAVGDQVTAACAAPVTERTREGGGALRDLFHNITADAVFRTRKVAQ